MVEFCAEKGLWCMGNAYFQYKSLHKYTKVARDQDGVEMKGMIDLMAMKKDMLRYVQDVRAGRGMGRGLSEHHAVQCKVRFVGASWMKRREVVYGARRIISEKLREYRYREGYEENRVEWNGENNVEHMSENLFVY